MVVELVRWWLGGGIAYYWRIRYPKSDFRASGIGQKSWVLGKLNKQPFLQYFKFSLIMFHIKKLVPTCLIIKYLIIINTDHKYYVSKIWRKRNEKKPFSTGESKTFISRRNFQKSKTWVLSSGFWVLRY